MLWDTTLNKLDEPEILFIMAHEMGHYVMKHVYIGLGGYLLLSLAVFYVIDKLYKRIIGRYGRSLHIAGKSDLAALPLLLMLMGSSLSRRLHLRTQFRGIRKKLLTSMRLN